ncbi:hypothetical protein LO771_18265 [Streptacidiphilus sp. ASG 303]|nr:hypothetical protein [Streptacidiphilus sp. ASG 303]MCD0484287.1 hypothetical protein [Streptacidiphilus sp. ASG 303]
MRPRADLCTDVCSGHPYDRLLLSASPAVHGAGGCCGTAVEGGHMTAVLR